MENSLLTYTLKRWPSQDFGTFGEWLDETNTQFMVCVERPWLNNQRNVSCIPPGPGGDITYKCVRIQSAEQELETPGSPDRFMITGVEGREDIEIHVGNFARNSKGCICVGMSFGKLGLDQAVLDSKDAFDMFMARMEGIDEFLLRIISGD